MIKKLPNIYLHPSRDGFYSWLQENHSSQHECYVAVFRQDPSKLPCWQLSYLDAVEVALCFGWIDSTAKKIDHVDYQRFSPRRKNSHWTELNKERVRRLIRLGEMTEHGLAVCHAIDTLYQEPQDIIQALKKDKTAYDFFRATPSLYQRIRLDNIQWVLQRTKDINKYKASIDRLIKYCRQRKLYGRWDDYGRLAPEANEE